MTRSSLRVLKMPLAFEEKWRSSVPDTAAEGGNGRTINRILVGDWKRIVHGMAHISQIERQAQQKIINPQTPGSEAADFECSSVAQRSSLRRVFGGLSRKPLGRWWPGTGSNRRRRPFQGRALPLSYLASALTTRQRRRRRRRLNRSDFTCLSGGNWPPHCAQPQRRRATVYQPPLKAPSSAAR